VDKRADSLDARGEVDLRAEFVCVLDRMVGFASRGLLIPADTLLRRLARKLGRERPR
jgi:hypothetical protein